MAPDTHKLSDIQALAWQAEMGADECVETSPSMPWAKPVLNPPAPSLRGSIADVAIQRTENVATTAGLPRSARNDDLKTPSISAVESIMQARKLSNEANTLSELEIVVRSFNGCGLKKTATNTVFAQGVPESRVMFVGEAPGADEDKQGFPFVGVSGQLLDRMLGFIGLERSKNFYITNTLFWRPPGNRKPTAEELDICRPFVEKHIALVNPKVLVLVGGTATQSVLGDTRGITRLRGQVFSYKNEYMEREVPVHVIYHPSYLLRQPAAKKQAWADLLGLKAALAG
jgi:DNA polymerase